MKTIRFSALLLALLLVLCAVPAFASGEASGGASDELFAPMTFPEDAKIVSATMYSVYTKSPSSMQDAVSGATLEETPSYLDVLKTLYNEIMAGNYVEEN